MSGWVAGAVVVGAGIGAVSSSRAASKAAKASKKAAATEAGAYERAAAMEAEAQMEQLAYLKEREAIPQQFREEALTRLGGLAGLEGGVGSQQQLIEQAKISPLYQELLGGREAGEEAILRQAGATGGLRSGNVQAALAGYNMQLQNQALTQAYNQQLQGLQGLANLPSNVTQIGQTMAGIGQTQAAGLTAAGQTRAAGQIAAGQAQQAGIQGVGSAIGSGLGQLAGLKMGGYI